MNQRLTTRKMIHLLLVLAVLSFFFAYRSWFAVEQVKTIASADNPMCDLSHGRCAASVGKAAPQAEVAQLPVRAEQPFLIELNGGDHTIKPIKAWLEGRDMFMGTIPVVFEPYDEGWQAQALVGSCTSPLMVWLLTIEWSNGTRQQLALSVARE